MARKLGVFGLALPLIAIVGALIFLFAFGTDAPTFDAGARELARTNTVVRLSEEPSAALVVPEQAPQSMPILIILADDQRHIWQAATDLRLLPLVESEQFGILIAPGVADASILAALVEEVEALVDVELAALAGFDGQPMRQLCAEWSHAIIVAEANVSCKKSAVAIVSARVSDGENLGVRMVEAMRGFLELGADK